MAKEKIDIRDLRDGKFLWIDKAALDLVSRKTGSRGAAVYSWLCYYANYKAQDCFPSITTLAGHCGVTRRTVMRVIKQLELIRVIAIDRTNGKHNVYKLLNVEGRLDQKTGDKIVTSDSTDTGVVSPMSPVLVTPETPEQELYKQEITNKTNGCFFNFWEKVDLPYPLPSVEVFKELEGFCQEILSEINLFKFILHYRNDKGYPPHPDALIKLCKQFKQDKGRIKNVWGWFQRTVELQMRQFFAQMNIKEHERIKKEPTTVGRILAKMAGDG